LASDEDRWFGIFQGYRPHGDGVAGAEVVEPAATPCVVPDDPDDDKLVAAALASGAILVSNDAHLLAVAGHEGLEVLRPADLM
jgi:predicted nucleic acid-binding protein